ncbi:MAG: transposase [Burkholderiales bacterium]
MRTVARRHKKTTPALCAEAHGFTLHAAVRCGAHQRKELEWLCRYITRPAIANERLRRNGADVVLQLKSAYRDGTTHIVHVAAGIHAMPGRADPPRLHLIRFDAVLAPNARPWSAVVPAPVQNAMATGDDGKVSHSAPVSAG